MYRAKVSKKKELTTGVELVHLELIEPNQIEFKSGQFIELGSDKKKFYIASTPETKHGLDLVTNLNEFEIGDDVEFEGPSGEFGLEEVEEEMLVFVVEGMGIVPVRSMILDLIENGNEERMIRLHWGIDNLEELFWEEDLLQLTHEFPNFRVDVVVKHPPSVGWDLCGGEVDDCLVGHGVEWENGYFYVCSVEDRVDEIVDTIEDLRVSKDQITTEVV